MKLKRSWTHTTFNKLYCTICTPPLEQPETAQCRFPLPGALFLLNMMPNQFTQKNTLKLEMTRPSFDFLLALVLCVSVFTFFTIQNQPLWFYKYVYEYSGSQVYPTFPSYSKSDPHNEYVSSISYSSEELLSVANWT